LIEFNIFIFFVSKAGLSTDYADCADSHQNLGKYLVVQKHLRNLRNLRMIHSCHGSWVITLPFTFTFTRFKPLTFFTMLGSAALLNVQLSNRRSYIGAFANP